MSEAVLEHRDWKRRITWGHGRGRHPNLCGVEGVLEGCEEKKLSPEPEKILRAAIRRHRAMGGKDQLGVFGPYGNAAEMESGGGKL